VATLQRGFDLPTQHRVAGEFPLVSSSGISDTHHKSAVRGPGVVTGRSGSIGNVFFIDEDFWPLNTVLYVKDFHGNDPRFVFHLLKKFDLQRFASGAGVPTLNRNFVHDELVSVPPFSEQKRLVAILDEAFEGIATAAANAEKNLANARELQEIYVNSVFAQTAKQGSQKKLGDIAAFKNGLNFTKGSKGEIIKIVGVKDFQKNFYVPTDQLETAQIDGNLSVDYELRAGDILTVRSNGNKQLIGRCILASDVSEKTSHSGFTIRIRVASEEVSPAYLVHFLKSKASRELLIESGDGANISSLNQQALSALPVTLPSLSTQLAITEKIEAIAAETKSLEAIYRQKRDNLAELKQAILQKAFAGELTAQPEKSPQEPAAA
jgi:type I restriction enzyme, S subunit